jgi:hypothetical protein
MPSQESDSRTTNGDTRICLFWNPECQYTVHSGMPEVRNLNQKKPALFFPHQIT